MLHMHSFLRPKRSSWHPALAFRDLLLNPGILLCERRKCCFTY